jgi:hypothetical protein
MGRAGSGTPPPSGAQSNQRPRRLRMPSLRPSIALAEAPPARMRTFGRTRAIARSRNGRHSACSAREAAGRQHAVEELAGAAHEWLAARVLLRSRRFADQHHRSVRRPPEDDGAGGLGLQPAPREGVDGGLQLCKRRSGRRRVPRQPERLGVMGREGAGGLRSGASRRRPHSVRRLGREAARALRQTIHRFLGVKDVDPRLRPEGEEAAEGMDRNRVGRVHHGKSRRSP